MSVKKRYSFFITDELDEALKALKERDGMPEAEAIRRALAMFLKEKGVLDARAKHAPPTEKGGKSVRSK